MEIERKFLLSCIPFNLENYTCFNIEQAYITTAPVIRARKRIRIDDNTTAKIEEFILTIKSSGILSHEEYEIMLNEDEYKNVLKKAEGNVITKNRYNIPLDDGLILELDIFKGKFDGLIVGEIEFATEDAAKKYTPPEFISEEVTYDRRYSNSTMSKMSDDEISKFISTLH